MKPFLLLQARGGDEAMREHEHACFARAMDVSPDLIAAVDLVRDRPGVDALRGHRAVLIGGSGEYNGRGDDPWHRDALALARDGLIAARVPTFACCFGLHLIGRALGATVVHDPDNREVGTFVLHRKPGADGCPIFGALPPLFLAQQGHNDHLDRLPEGAVLLCDNPAIAVQAFRLPNAPLWATQFHPELDMEANKVRYLRYLANYVGEEGPAADDPVIASLRPTPLATALLTRFAHGVLDGSIV